MKTTVPDDTLPPGFFIREELEARGWTQRDLAFVLELSEQSVNLILAGKRGITADVAKKMGHAFDMSAQFFVNLQSVYDLANAKEPADSVARKAKLQSKFPLREMIKRGWIRATTNIDHLESEVCRFFGISSVDETPSAACAAKKTAVDGAEYSDSTPAQLAWLYRVRQMAREMPVPRFSETGFRAALDEMKRLLHAPEEARHVPRLLSECGVRFVIVESLPGAKIDGACTWLNTSAPVIGMSLRHDRLDNFWFVLRHEAEHVLQKHGQNEAMIDVNLESSGPDTSEEERVATAAALAFCVPQREFNNWIERKKPFFAERDLLGFAAKHRIHPSLVAGQLRKRLDRWDLFTKYNAKIRFAVRPGAIQDGWGDVAPVSNGGRFDA